MACYRMSKTSVTLVGATTENPSFALNGAAVAGASAGS